MEETYLLSYPGVKKKILAGGKGPLPHFPPGTKVIFHFQTLLDNFERTVVDDSRLAGRPAEIFVGKMFKMEIWESLLTSMRVGEVAEFWCDAVHTGLYPIVSKGMRLIAQGKDPLEGQKHMCGMGNLFHYHSTGFPELDEIMRNPQPLIFIMELLQVGDPLSYHRESWMMEKDEKLQTVPVLHMQGNALVRQKQFREAASKYKEAVLLLKTVQSREMPGDVDYINLGRMIVPLELNYCQCMLELEEYYEVIEHTTELLEKHKDCVKGYYKRAKAHAAVWNEKEARRDFSTVAQLDISLAALVRRELKELSERMKEKYWEEKEQYWNMLEKTEGASKQEEEEQQDEEEQKDEGAKKKESDIESGKAGEKTGSSEMRRVEEGESGAEEVRPSEGAKEEESSRAEELQACEEMEGKDWQQMLRLVMFLQNDGNFLIKEQRFPDASAKFKEALGYVDFLQNKVDQHGEDWESLEKVRLPLSLNLSQCMLELKQHQEVVELNSRLLKTHRGNFKATYQRARAHAALCNEDEARRDFATVEKLDPNLKPFVQKELKILGENIRKMHAGQKKNYWETTKEKWGPVGSRTKDAVRKKNTNSAKKATEKNTEMNKNTESHEVEEQESPAEHRPVETEGAGDTETETNPDLKAERRDKEQTCGRTSELGSDKENPARVAAPEADNHKTDKDGDPASTSSDNVVIRRSRHDKGKKKKKVKRQSRNAAKRTKSGTGNGDGPIN
ncbi:PREDICTED: golgin subfamily A member 6-like protein 22 isoform X2 [Poecilia mexicana]|uniref:golgin subfamily A member 6-like protein 22 isoform X2 n=1 Tax=Poecilia mexicana TaxID=48701 RepID=UPI00072DAED4|nr:PREDICTED: golgin subfamily A member 6-like protein 22 isoform X2 [Poecilia mexicana]